MSRPGGRRAGFTLIELLLVIVILAAIAGSAVAMLETATGDAQVRFDDTKVRLERLRTAIVGPEGATTPQGFVADVGRLPVNLTELVECPAALVGANPPIWRGPYLRTLPAPGGALVFPDGWGSSTGAPLDFGWNVHLHLSLADDATTIAPIESGDLHVQSLGSDGVTTAIPTPPAPVDVYAADYPPTPDTTVSPQRLPFIRCADYLVSVAEQGCTLVVAAGTARASVDVTCTFEFNLGVDQVGLPFSLTNQPLTMGENTLFLPFTGEDTELPIGRRRVHVTIVEGTTTILDTRRTFDVLPRTLLPTFRVVTP